MKSCRHRFGDANELIESRLAEGVMVALPTYLHAPIGIQALEAGLHLMMEKPLACHTAASELILDCLNRTENAMAQEHAFKAAELSLQAQAMADSMF